MRRWARQGPETVEGNHRVRQGQVDPTRRRVKRVQTPPRILYPESHDFGHFKVR